MSLHDVSPYEILEVPPTATLPQIMAAYSAALRRNKYPRERIAEAFHDLRNPRKRAEHDLFELGALGDPTQARAALDELPRQPFLLLDEVAWPDLPPVPPPTAAELRAEQLPIPIFPHPYERPALSDSPLTALPAIEYPS